MEQLRAAHTLHAKSPQSCLTLGNPMDCSPPGSSVHGISQARILEWVALGIFSTQGSNPHLLCLLHWQEGSLPFVQPGKPIRPEAAKNKQLF